ncbi:uncharacterized protein LOC122724611 [Manihot esculenta]|uniref:uncharacterized protein LOC122724611 n=1 Tax=Manihot esculenta TaxID=3983 RepID=UPI001CC61DF4|nr:uncharacterized protein LOC122724611 [Manihot esculenta]
MDYERIFELVPPLISDADNADLCAPFSNEEFRDALFQMHLDKAPGPDGLNPTFYQRFWHLIGNDVSDGNKIVGKVLANKFKMVLPMIISENQSVFIPHQLITDNVMVVFEMIHNMKINKGRNDGNCALKLDISKAYDMVEWEFLKGVLERFGFSTQWIRFLTRDPISPYLYLVYAEGLSLLLKDVEFRGWLLEEADSIKSILNTYAAAS